jgi:hypothetical protein
LYFVYGGIILGVFFFLLKFNPTSLVHKHKSGIMHDEKAVGKTALSRMVFSKRNMSACFQSSVAGVAYD